VFDITTIAVEKLKSIMDEEGAPGAALRVVVVPSGNGVQYMLAVESEPKEDDVVTDAEGLKVVVDSDSVPLLEGAEIDYVDTLARSGFVISNPNVSVGGCGSGSGGCGCGGNCGCGSGH
jgi:iron-sulfur cluster assembly accessory protein